MILGQMYPSLISPFSHGIELRPGRGYSYIGALYNLFVCAGVGVIVTFFTKPNADKQLTGLTVFDVHKLKKIFKGSSINEAIGKPVVVNFKVKDLGKDMVSFSKHDMKTINANKGDLVYIQDSRWWLGGLKSIHATFDDPHDENGIVYMSEVQRDSGMFIDNLPLKAEKEM